MGAGPGERAPPSSVSWHVRFTPLADDDVAETYAWYESARSGLGEDFLRDLQRALDFIVAYPDGCPVVHQGLRRGLLGRFPYSLYYRVIEAGAMLEVRACVHQSRHPQNWHRRA
jgi:toxin ParE1/3/4